ncbi:hypothetical protein [Winogradskyella forsetii]|uniref:hypothetical protein n=1 Tax=Winogradskyella forsetii TaxID=2686077 RepID=UPI0015B87546|nr:hypothetical protein [Winogradskyella forsetii]
MKKIIYIYLLGFISVLYSQQGNYELNTDDLNMVEDSSTGFLEIELCVTQGQGIYNLKPVLVNLNNPSEVIPDDLEYRLIPITHSAPLPNDPFFESIDLNLNDLRIYLGMTGNQRRLIQFRIEVIDYDVGDPYYQYRLWDRIFVITLSNDQPLVGNAEQDITTTCNTQPTVRDLETNSSYSYITYYNDQGEIIPSNTQIIPADQNPTGNQLTTGDVVTLYPKNSAGMGDNNHQVTCDISGLEITIGIVTIGEIDTYTGPRLAFSAPNNYPDIPVCDIDDDINIDLLSEDPSQPLDFSNGQYFLRRDVSPYNTLPLTPVFDPIDGSFENFTVNLLNAYGNWVFDSFWRLYYTPSDDNGPITLCNPIYSNRFSINIENEGRSIGSYYDREYFTNGLDDLDNDGIAEDELTYKGMYNLFVRGQEELIGDLGNPTPNAQGFLQFVNRQIIMYTDESLTTPITNFDDIVAELNDLRTECNATFYFTIDNSSTGECSGPYYFDTTSQHRRYRTLTISLRDLITTYTNPDQYFCSADNPTFESLQLLAEGTGNPIYVWGSEFGNDLIYDPTQSTGGDVQLQNGDEYWIQEFGYPNVVCTNNYAEMFSSQRFYVQVHIVNNCSPETAECPCNSFELERGDKYIVSAWVKEDHVEQVLTYEDAKLDLTFLQGEEIEQEFSFSPTGEIIEGWQRIIGEFFVPITATKVRIDLNNTDGIVVNPEPVDINDYFEPIIPQQYLFETYTVNVLNEDFSNCDNALQVVYTLLAPAPLIENKVYRVSNIFGGILGSQYIKVLNVTNNPSQIFGITTIQSSVTCNELYEVLNPTAPETDRVDVFYDDIRIHPFNGNMKSFVYDPITQRLMAELDENNYATMYEYDEEGGLIRVKKETEKGVFTIQETRSKSATKN